MLHLVQITLYCERFSELVHVSQYFLVSNFLLGDETGLTGLLFKYSIQITKLQKIKRIDQKYQSAFVKPRIIKRFYLI